MKMNTYKNIYITLIILSLFFIPVAYADVTFNMKSSSVSPKAGESFNVEVYITPTILTKKASFTLDASPTTVMLNDKVINSNWVDPTVTVSGTKLIFSSSTTEDLEGVSSGEVLLVKIPVVAVEGAMTFKLSGLSAGKGKILDTKVSPGSALSVIGQSSGGAPPTTDCTPKASCKESIKCGTESDGCGGTLNCGSCATGQTCKGGACVDNAPPAAPQEETDQEGDEICTLVKDKGKGSQAYKTPGYISNLAKQIKDYFG